MATAFPAGIDSFLDPVGTDLLDNATAALKHATQHTNVNDAVNAIETQLNLTGLLTGTGVPGGGLGVNTNLYLDLASGIIYRKTAGTWAAIYTPSAGGGGAAGNPVPADVGLIGWNFDPAPPVLATSSAAFTSGQPWAWRISLPAATISNLYFLSAGGGTATNFFMAIYNAAGTTMLRQSTNAVTAYNAGGLTPTACPLTSPLAITAGTYYIIAWFSGGSQASVFRSANNAPVQNLTATAPNLRFSQLSNTGLTTVAPATLGTQSTAPLVTWVGVS